MQAISPFQPVRKRIKQLRATLRLLEELLEDTDVDATACNDTLFDLRGHVMWVDAELAFAIEETERQKGTQ